MPLTPEERAAVNRANARKSTGPKTEAGKANSRKNALKHGLRAESLALPNEDPAAVEARARDWFDYYAPQSPAAVHLTNQCVRATLLSDRLDQFQTAVLGRQVREAELRFVHEKEDEVARLRELLLDDPATAVRHLKRSSLGGGYLATRWRALGETLKNVGFWDVAEREEAIRLQGLSPDPQSFHQHPTAAITFFYAILCLDHLDENVIRRTCNPDLMPLSIRCVLAGEKLPTAAEARAELLDLVSRHLRELEAENTYLFQQIDAPALAAATEQALVIQDPSLARLFLRYSAEARSSFHRAYRELTLTLNRDREIETENDFELDSTHQGASNPNKPIAGELASDPEPTPAPPPDEPAAVPPNEATPPHTSTKAPETRVNRTEPPMEPLDDGFPTLAFPAMPPHATR